MKCLCAVSIAALVRYLWKVLVRLKLKVLMLGVCDFLKLHASLRLHLGWWSREAER